MAAQLDTESFVPDTLEYDALESAVQKCRGCPLYKDATQAVFGDGARRASIVLVGEQPGDFQEDLAGEPFVGPAGRMLDELLEQAEVARSDVFVTNAVKHFKFEERGKKRLHKRPAAYEIDACRPWLATEIELVRPKVLVALGASAARSLLGKTSAIGAHREALHPSVFDLPAVVTYHPSAALRHPRKEERQRIRDAIVADLRRAAEI